MTRDEAIDKFEHQFGGMLLNSWSANRTGEAQILFVRRLTSQVQVLLGQAFDAGYQSAQQDAEKISKPTSKRELFGKGKKGDEDTDGA